MREAERRVRLATRTTEKGGRARKDACLCPETVRHGISRTGRLRWRWRVQGGYQQRGREEGPCVCSSPERARPDASQG